MQIHQTVISNQYTAYTIRPSIGRSEFQTQHAIDTANREDFNFFCSEQHCDEAYQGPYMCIWFNKAGKLVTEWVGRKRVLRSTTAK